MSFLPLFSLFLASLLLTAILTHWLIPLLRRKKLGQTILSDGPIWHKSKEGTPTMGGAVFLFTLPFFTLLGSFWVFGSIPPSLLFVLLFAIANGFVGMIDDGTKLKNKRNLGLLPWQKLFLQAFFLGAFLYLLFRFSKSNLDTTLPFFNIPLPTEAPILFFFFLLLLGNVNCVNLSDGIDGLTASSAFVIGSFFILEGHLYKEGVLLLLGVVLCGTMLGFLWFNRHPAKIFMGDTGSLFLGALLCGSAFLTKNPAVLPIYTFLFLLEGGSVILQVLVFKRTGKRLFRMAPLHHHLEKCGWGERRIVFVFSFITLLSCLFAHFALI